MAAIHNRLTMLLVAFVSAALPTVAAGAELTAHGPHAVHATLRALADAFRDQTDHQVTIVENESVTLRDAGHATLYVTTRDLTARQLAAGWVATPIATDAVIVIVHPSNTISNVTQQELKYIFAGRTKRWPSDQPIALFTGTAPTAAREAFVEVIMGEQPFSDTATQKPLRATIFTIRKAVNAVTFVSLGSLTAHDRVKRLSVDGIEPTPAAIHAGTYPITQTVYLVTQGEPTGPTAQFVNFATSDEGQRLIAAAGLVPIADLETWLYLAEPLAQPSEQAGHDSATQADAQGDPTAPLSVAPQSVNPADEFSNGATSPVAVGASHDAAPSASAEQSSHAQSAPQPGDLIFQEVAPSADAPSHSNQTLNPGSEFRLDEPFVFKSQPSPNTPVVDRDVLLEANRDATPVLEQTAAVETDVDPVK